MTTISFENSFFISIMPPWLDPIRRQLQSPKRLSSYFKANQKLEFEVLFETLNEFSTTYTFPPDNVLFSYTMYLSTSKQGFKFQPKRKLKIPNLSRYDLSREEKNLRRTQSFSSVPIAFNHNNGHNPMSELGKPRGERIIRQTTTTINPGTFLLSGYQ